VESYEVEMTHEEKNTLVALVTNLLVTGFFAIRLIQMYQAGAFDGADSLVVWARTVLWMIPVSIVVTIVLMILFQIGFAIATRDAKPSFIIDERDKQFSRWSYIATIVVAGAGWMVALILLAFGLSAFAALNIVLFAFGAGDLASHLVKLYRYRRGY
jgi:hypothetical protein